MWAQEVPISCQSRQNPVHSKPGRTKGFQHLISRISCRIALEESGCSDKEPSNSGSVPESENSNPYLVLLAVASGLFMVVIDVTILNIALPSISRDMQATMAQVEWAIIAYTLTLTGLVPIFGRISDIIGRKKLFLSGVSVFALASLFCAYSVSMEGLILGRVLQALGGAMITSNTLAIIADTFPEGKRGLAMGLQAILVSGGAAIGPSLGGFLVTNYEWHSVFLINVPIGFLSVIFAAFVLPPLKTHRRLEPLDWAGAATVLAGSGSLLLGLTLGPQKDWNDTVIVCLVCGALLYVVLFLMEKRHPHPLIDMNLFRIRGFVFGQLAGVCATISLAAMTFVFPWYWQGLRGLSAQEAGILILPLPLTLMILSPLSGKLSDRFGTRGVASVGLIILMLGEWAIAGIHLEMGYLDVIWRIVLFGAGLGFFLAPNNNAIMSSVSAHRRGVAAGILGLFRYTGQSLGVALSGVLFHFFSGHSHLPDGSELSQQQAELFMRGMQGVALSILPLGALGLYFSWRRVHNPHHPGG